MTARVIPTIYVSRFTRVKPRWEPHRSIVGMTLAVILVRARVVILVRTRVVILVRTRAITLVRIRYNIYLSDNAYD